MSKPQPTNPNDNDVPHDLQDIDHALELLILVIERSGMDVVLTQSGERILDRVIGEQVHDLLLLGQDAADVGVTKQIKYRVPHQASLLG